MKETKIIQSLNLSEGIQVKETILVLAATLLMPMLIHLIPVSGSTPVGAMLLPIFYAPLVAVIFFRLHVALIPAILAPAINYFLTGHPAAHLLPVMTLELVVFVAAIAFILHKKSQISWIAAPLAYIIAKVGSVVLLTVFPSLMEIAGFEFAMISISNAWPGIIALLLINILCLKLKK
ncbi:MAG: hypothetical protein JJU28_20700 [Cyclobacteriaceae bacterium]|nr:hypothetical protein [Cyclobacteriaceae bacterium]